MLLSSLGEPRELSSAVNQHYLTALSLRYRVLPLIVDETTLTLVTSDQSDSQAVPAFRFVTGKLIATVLWDQRRLQAALAQLQAQPIVLLLIVRTCRRHDLSPLIKI